MAQSFKFDKIKKKIYLFSMLIDRSNPKIFATLENSGSVFKSFGRNQKKWGKIVSQIFFLSILKNFWGYLVWAFRKRVLQSK